MVSGGGRILNIIKLITEYDMPTASDTVLRVRIKIITEGLDSNLTTILKDQILNSELSDVLEDFGNMIVNDDDIKKLQSKKRKRNKCYYTKDITHGFQSNITSNKRMDIIKCI